MNRPESAVPHRKRILFHMPTQMEQACSFRILRAVREQFASTPRAFRQFVFPDYKIATVERGGGWVMYGGRRAELSPGTVYVLFPHVPVSFGPDPADPMDVTFVVTIGEGMSAVLASAGLTPESPTVQLGPAPELRGIFRALRDRDGAYVPRMHGLLWSFLARVTEAAGRGAHHGTGDLPDDAARSVPERLSGAHAQAEQQAASPLPPAPPAGEDAAIGRALVALRLHMYEPELRLADLARAAYLGRSQFAARFRRAVGCSPGDYLERLRLSEARALLADDDLSIAEVAHRAGFKDPAYFARRFRRATGASPSDFRGHRRGPHAGFPTGGPAATTRESAPGAGQSTRRPPPESDPSPAGRSR